MASEYDLVIRSGSVIDGTGVDRRIADVAVKDGRIAAIGTVKGRGAEEIDAEGLLVMPGFVDIHTHYDGQATWAERMQPSSWHGVTTVVMGNCGVGFAPCKPEDRERLIRLMEGVEDIPNPVMTEGLPWNWQSFPEYMDALGERQFDVDIGVQIAHAPMRVYAMGERGADREPATSSDMAAMAEIAREAMVAGALGFSTSRTINHKTSDGEKVPTYGVAEEELMGIALGLKAADAGVLQLISDFEDPAGDFAMMRRLVEGSGRPLSFSLMERAQAPQDWRILLSSAEQARREGLPMSAQVPCRPVGLLLGLEGSANAFVRNPIYLELTELSHAERVERLKDPSFRARLLAEHEANPTIHLDFPWHMHYPLDDGAPNYEPARDTSVAARAAATGVSPAEFSLDHMLTNGGRGMLLIPIFNYHEGNLEVSREMLASPISVPGLSDGGAHMGLICDGSFPTTLLQHWTRDREGTRFTVEEVVKMQAHDTAKVVGLHDRGLIAPGMRADVIIVDHARLKVRAPEFAYDLPAGGKHLVQRADGYRYTIVAGHITYRDGEPTGALPGRLVRGAQPAPSLAA
jgi:N-acyl-D-aspartate/D-glutamate deacylase